MYPFEILSSQIDTFLVTRWLYRNRWKDRITFDRNHQFGTWKTGSHPKSSGLLAGTIFPGVFPKRNGFLIWPDSKRKYTHSIDRFILIHHQYIVQTLSWYLVTIQETSHKLDFLLRVIRKVPNFHVHYQVEALLQ